MSSIPFWIVLILVICMVTEPDAVPVTKPATTAAGTTTTPTTPVTPKPTTQSTTTTTTSPTTAATKAAGASTTAALTTTGPTTGPVTDPTTTVTTTGTAGTGVAPTGKLAPPCEHMTCRYSYWILLAPQEENPPASIETRRGPARGHFPCLPGETCYSVENGENWRVYVLRNHKYPEIFGTALTKSGVYKITNNGTEMVPAFSSDENKGFEIFEVNLIASKYPRTHYHLTYEYKDPTSTDEKTATVTGKLFMHFRKPKPVASVYTAYPAIPEGMQLTSLKVMDIETTVFSKNVTETGPFYMINVYTDEGKVRYFKKAEPTSDFSIILMEKHLGAVAAVTEQYQRRLVPPAVTCVDGNPCYSISDGGNWNAYILRFSDKFPEIFGQPLQVPPGVYKAELGEITPVEVFLPQDGKDGKVNTHLFEAQVVHLGIPREQLQLIYEYQLPATDAGEGQIQSARLGLTFHHLYGRECHLTCHPALPPGSMLVYLTVTDGKNTLMSIPVTDGVFYHVKVDLIEGAVRYSK